MIKPTFLVLAFAALAGCATMSQGTKAQVAIDTPGAMGATCTVTDAAGKVRGSTRTPGTVTLQKARADLTVTCTKAGYATATQALNSSMADRAKLQMPTGYVVDAASGAMWTYPASISIPMTKG